ncbi:MAG TPA: hypothetical protein DCK83_03510 [Gallionellaceae bacterium]|nr:hypothetical protein [Gallionellaceae bacterium]
MIRSYFGNSCRKIYGLLAAAGLSVSAYAQPLEDMRLEFQDSGVVATILLTGPVQYQSHFPASHGDTLEIFYERVKGPAGDEKWADNEVLKSPPSGLIPSFTVTTRDQNVKPKLVVQFSREAEYSVSMGKDNRSLLITIKPEKRPVLSATLTALPVIKPEVAVAAGATAMQVQMAEVNTQARALMVKGREALVAKNNEVAVDNFNKLLLLPPNDYTQDGQEWVGVARQRAGQLDKAKVEYDLYLRLYPNGEGASRVAQRLNTLGDRPDDPKPTIVQTKERKKQAARWLYFGGVSSHYYYGSSKTDSTFVLNNTSTTTSQSSVDQSMLISTVNASQRYLSEEFDGRLVFSDVNMLNFVDNQPSQNRLNVAYGEIKGRTSDYLVRVGRQSSMGSGVQSRFDGIAGGYGDSRSFRVNAVAGRVADYSDSSKPRFAGLSVESGMMSFYGINQTVDGVQDRRALGTEFRYYQEKQTVYALLDYDAYFKAVNTAQIMGSNSMPGYNLNYMIDHRKPLSIRNALNGAGTSSVSTMLQAVSPTGLRQLALARTSISNLGQVGVSVPVRKNWQAIGTLRVSNTTGVSGIDPTGLSGYDAASPTSAALVGSTTALPGRGLEKGLTGQVIGSNLLREGDTWSASLSFSNGSAVKGNSLFFYNHTQFNSGWTMDSSLQFSNHTDQNGGTSKRTAPMVRGSYRIRDELYVDGDFGLEFANYSGPTQSDKTTRTTYSLGMRWDF